ncbi:MAG: CapA family protein [Acetobacteraceae bacterium]|nr:CapA family protein [Acetobacteraceae bacterium]
MSLMARGPRFSLACVGDVYLQGPVASKARCRPGPAGPGSPAAGMLREADLALGNLEAPLTAAEWPADKVACLKTDPGLAGEVKALGLDAVTVANNHALDYGPQGLLDTLEALKVAGVPACGGGANLQRALAPAWVEVKGAKVAVLGFCSALPPGFAATSRRPGVAPVRVRQAYLLDAVTAEEQPGTAPYVLTRLVEADVERACGAVTCAREQGADVVVAQVHWGVPAAFVAPFQGPEMDYQPALAHRLIDAGADLVAGHHPHAPSGLEFYRGRVVLYSLGNFVFHRLMLQAGQTDARPIPPYSPEAMAHVALGREKDGLLACVEFQGGELKSVRLVALTLDQAGEPWVAGGRRSRAILERVEALSQRYCPGLRVESDGRVVWEGQGGAGGAGAD